MNDIYKANGKQMLYEMREKMPLYSINHTLCENIHCHPEMEIIVCYEGGCSALINSQEIQFEAGEFVVVFPNQMHSYKHLEGSNFRVLIFSLDCLPHIKKYISSNLFSKNKFSFNESENVAEIMARLKNRLENDDFVDTTKFIGYLNLLMADIIPTLEVQSISRGDNELLINTLNYCNENFTQRITLEDIADAMRVTPSKISRMLNRRFEMSLPQFIGNLRISEACNYLKSTELTVAEISGRVGVDSIRSFNRLFIKIIGQTPTEYRKNHSKK